MAKDPYKYFRIEAAELLSGLTQGFLRLEKQTDVQLVAELFRLAHTFKGASRVVKRPDIADIAHALEDLLAPHRQSGGPVDAQTIDRALGLTKSIRALVEELGHPDGLVIAASGPEQRAHPAPLREGVNVPVRDLDRVFEATVESHGRAVSTARRLEELEVAIKTLKRTARRIEEGDFGGKTAVRLTSTADNLSQVHRSLEEGNDRLLSELSALKDAVTSMRLVPTKNLANDIEQIAREAARTLGKSIRFEAHIEATHLDARIEVGVREALVHLVQNGIAHGIESPSERRALGKPSDGLISLHLRRAGPRLLVSCRDDGKGFDAHAIRESLVRGGTLTRTEALFCSEEELKQAASIDGFSTNQTVSDVSGRGIGLGAAEAAIHEIRGALTLETLALHGTTVHIDVPFTLSLSSSLSLYSGNVGVLIPLDSVRQAVRIRREQIEQRDERQHLRLGDAIVPYISLARALNLPETDPLTPPRSAVVLQVQTRRVALGVDRIGGARTVVLHDLPEHAQASDLIEGAVLDEDGIPAVMLDPAALVRRSESSLALEPQSRAAPSTLPVLIIDDSLTTRMLEQSILEAAGYEVELATSGEEGLKKARQRVFGAFIVDVEMPQMNGFEFIEHVKQDDKLRETPAILVTSLDSPEHKRRGKEVGAHAYIVKSDFDQERLLSILRRFA